MATNFVAKLWQNYLHPALIALSFRNGMGYRYRNMHINSANCPNEGKVILRVFFARSPDGSTVFSLLLATGRHCRAERAIC